MWYNFKYDIYVYNYICDDPYIKKKNKFDY